MLLLDEPTSACDAEAARAVERLVSKAAVGAVVWVTHDAAQAERVASATLQLRRDDEEAAAPALEAEPPEARDNK